MVGPIGVVAQGDDLIRPQRRGPVGVAAGKDRLRRMLLHLMVAADVIQIRVSDDDPAQVGRIAACFSHLRDDEVIGIVGAAGVEQDRGRFTA